MLKTRTTTVTFMVVELLSLDVSMQCFMSLLAFVAYSIICILMFIL